MSLFKAQTPAQIIEKHSEESHSCKSSYSAQHPMLAARLTVKSIRKRDHLENYQEVNPFARAEAGVTRQAIDDLFFTIDVNRNGKISYSEFSNYIRLDMVEPKNISENEFYQKSPPTLPALGYLPSEGIRHGVITGRMFDEVANNNKISLFEFRKVMNLAKNWDSSKDWIRFYSFHTFSKN
jgi:hypothetical protein